MSGVSMGRGTSGEDYSEGTFSPSITGATVVGAPVVTGNWTKVGRMIYYNIRIACDGGNTFASTGGATYVNNMPFTCNTSFNGGSGCVTNGSLADLGVGVVALNTTRYYFPTMVAQTSPITISGWYQV